MCRKLIYLISFVLVLGLAGSASAALPQGWTSQDIGSSTGGSASESGGTWTVSGNGNDIWNNADAFHYAFVPMSGDGMIVARVVDNGTGSNNWAKGGVMIRQDNTAPSAYAFSCITGGSGNGNVMQWRDSQGAGAAPGGNGPTPAGAPPYWVRLEREGNTFRGYRSVDGIEWEQMQSDHEVVMTDPVLIGLAVTSHASGEVRTFTFDNVSTELPKIAMKPEPADGVLHADTWANLSWSPGATAVSHDVYFGEIFDDVNDGAADTFQGNQASTFYIVGFPGFPYPEGLVPGTTYYWRVDEVNDTDPNSPWKGDVWSFFVPPRTAYNPIPADGAKFVNTDVELSWDPGFGAKLHYVHFGDNFDDVNNATGGLPLGNTTYTPGTLELDKVYYWRVDEFDAVTTHKGEVWSFKTLPVIPITDPNLVGWWKFEASAGTMVVDFSGHGNHGTIVDNVQWVPGQFNLALEFLGDDQGHVELPAGLVTTAKGSVAMWVNTDLTTDEGMFWYGTETGGDGFGGENEIHIHIDDPGVLGFGLEGATDVRLDGPQLAGAGWTHVAVTWDLTDGCRLYANGVEVDFQAHNSTVADLAVIRLGRPVGTGNGNRYHDGLMDDVRLFDHAISAAQVSEVMSKGEDPLRAGTPNPRNGSRVPINLATPLSWSAGENASEHDVYFGTDQAAVVDADASDTTGVYRGRQGSTSYNTSQDVEWGGGPYYWRIDEYNTDATISKGNVWSFTVTDFIVIDDFEDYDVGNNEIWWVWIDGLGYPVHPTKPPHPGNGTGSMVGDETTGSYMEETIVHGGGKSVPVFYDNNQQGKLRYSEVEKTLSSQQDWTVEGVGVLSLWFYGVASNAAEPLYVALNGNAVVTHDNPNAAQIEDWTEWTIDLQLFADQGVNLANVNTIAIGLGNKKNPVAGGSGTIYIDDIRLYRPAP